MRRGRLSPTLAVLVLLGTIGGVASSQTLNPRDTSAGLIRDVRVELVDLAARVRTLRDAAKTTAVPTDDLKAAVERIRAMDLLMAERDRQLQEHLRNEGVSAQVQQRQRDNARLVRDGLDRVYAAAAPLAVRETDPPLAPAAVRSVLDALAAALASPPDDTDRAPLGVTLPHRSLSLPQIAPAAGASITPAYLDPNAAPPVASDSSETAEAALSPVIRARASALGRDPIALFEFVHNEIDTEFYYGSMKGAEDTLRHTAGNDTDQASLLVALLRASGIPARYVRGVIVLTGAEAMSWTGVASPRRAAEVFTRAGVPHRAVAQGGAITSFEVEHTWVEAFVSYSNYRGAPLGTTGQAWIALDPSFKRLDVSPGTDVLAASGFTANTLVAEYLSSSQAKSPLAFYQSHISDYLTASRPDLTFEQSLADVKIRAERSGLLPNTLPYDVLAVRQELSAVPDNLKHQVRVMAEGEGGVSFDITIPVARIAGRRLTLSYVAATVEDQDVANAFLGLDNTPAYLVKVRPVLKIGGGVEAAGATPIQMGALHSFTVEIRSPRETIPIVNSIVAGGYYAIGLSAGSSRYDTPLVRAPADTEHPAADRLFSLASTYHQQWHEAEQMLGRMLRVVAVHPTLSHVMVGNAYTRTLLFGQPQAIDWRGVFVDADLHVTEPVPVGTDNTRAPEFMKLSGLAGSMLEGQVLQEQLTVDAVSAARLIQLAGEGGIPIDDIDSANIATALPQIQTADIVKTEIADAVNQGWRVTVPRRDLVRHAWAGIGYIMIDPATGAGGYFISGGFAGGETTQTPEEWVEELAEELGTPYQDDPNDDPTAAHSIIKIAVTDGQNGTAGAPTRQPVAVWVRDAEGKPVEGATVTFRIAAGGGRFGVQGDTTTAITNRKGIAEATPELGRQTADAPFYVRAQPDDLYDTRVGENLVAASVRGTGGEIPLDAPFQLFGFPGAPANLLQVLSPQGLIAAGTVAGTLRARVVDANQNPVSNVFLRFEVRPPVPRQGPVPPSAINLQLYLKEACPVPVPLLGDCPTFDQTSIPTSLWGAQVETILGDTADTTFTVRVSTDDLSPTAGDQRLTTEFTLTSAGRRDYSNPGYLSPTLTATLLQLVNDRGEPLNAAEVGTTLPRPVEVVVVVLEDNYRVESTGAPCLPEPAPACYRVVSLQTTRVRPVDIGRPGEVTFAGAGGTVLTMPKEQESARVQFAVPVGGGSAFPSFAELPEHSLGGGRYQATITVGPAPALNRVLIDPTAFVWFPAFNLRSSNPVVPLIARLRPGQRVTGADLAASPPVVTVGPADFYPTNLEHDVFGVRARIVNDDPVLLGETGGAMTDVDIKYVIEPEAYNADLAGVDMLEGRETVAPPVWRGTLPGTTTHGEGYGRIHRGTGGFGEGEPFDATKDYSVQLVLNRGGDAEVRSDAHTLGVYLAGPLGVDFRARENSARESRRPRDIRLATALSEEKARLIDLIGDGLTDGASCGVPTSQIAILEQGSGACFWSARFSGGGGGPPDLVAACSGFQAGISDHDYEVLVPDVVDSTRASCLVDKLNKAAEDPARKLGAVSFFKVSREEVFNGKLNINRPSGGGSDAVGDVGLGRQTLLFKWALEGEWVTGVQGLQAPTVNVGGTVVPLLDYVLNTLRTQGTIGGETTGIPRLEGLEWGILQHYNFYKAGAHVGITGTAVDPKSHLYALRQKAIHDAAKAGIRAATGRLIANRAANALFLEATRASYRSPGGCLTGTENPSDPPPAEDLFPKPCDSFEEHIASTAIRSFLNGTPIAPPDPDAQGPPVPLFSNADIALIYQFYRIKEDVACATAGCQTEITNEADANAFIAAASRFIRTRVVEEPLVISAYQEVIARPDSEAAKRLENRNTAEASRLEARDKASYVLEARVFNDNDLELSNIPVNMYPSGSPAVSYPVPRVLGRSSPPTGEIHDPRWTDTIIDVRRDFNGQPIPSPEDGKPQPVFELDIDARQLQQASFVFDPGNAVSECNKTDNASRFFTYPIDLDNPTSIPTLPGVPPSPAPPAACAGTVPALRVEKLVNNQAEITVATRTRVSVVNKVTNTGAVPLQGVQVVDLLVNQSPPPFNLAPGETRSIPYEFSSLESGTQFVGPTEVLAFVPTSIIPGGRTVSAWDSVRVNIVDPSCSIVVTPPTPDPNPYNSDGNPVSTMMKGGTVYRYYKAYGATPEALVELIVNGEAVGARVNDEGDIAHYEPHPVTGEPRLVPGLEITHDAAPEPGRYDVRFVSIGGSTALCSQPFQIDVTPREFTRGFSAGGAIEAAGTLGVGITGKAGSSLDVKITEQPGPLRTKLSIARSVNGKLGVQAGISSPKAKFVIPGFRGQIGASAQATLAGLVTAGDTHEFKYQPNSTQLSQQDAAALGALILATVAERVPLAGKILDAIIDRVGNLDQYRTTDSVSMGLQAGAGGEAAAIAGLSTFNKADSSSLGTMKYGLGLQGSVGVQGSAIVSVDSKPLVHEIIPGIKINVEADFSVSGGLGDVSDEVDEDTGEKALKLEEKLKGAIKGSIAGSKGAKLTLDTENEFKPTKLTFSVAPKKTFGWEVAGSEYTIADGDADSDDVTFTYTFEDPAVIQELIDHLASIQELTAIGAAGVATAGAVVGPLAVVAELHTLWQIAARHDGRYETATQQGHATALPLELDLGAGARVKMSGNVNFDRSITFHSEKGVVKNGVSFMLERYEDDDLIPDLQDVEEISDLFNVSFSGLLAEIGPVVDVVRQAVVALVNVIRSRNTAELTFDGATAPFSEMAIASYKFAPTPGPVAPALQLPSDSSGPADSPHYGIGGFHQFLPENQQLTAPGTLKIFYADNELGPIDERTLAIYEWNAAAGDWDHLGGTVDPVANTVTTTVRRMALYTAAPPMPASRFTFATASAPSGTQNDPRTTLTATSAIIRMNTGVVVPDGTMFTVRTLTPQGTDLTTFGSVTSADADPLLDGIQVRSVGGVVRFTADLPGSLGAVRFLVHAVRGTAQADQIVAY